jgi:trimethylamine:corrinoid methyltransferase-like protein
MTESKTHRCVTAPYKPLSDDDAEKIVTAAIRFVSEIGVKFDPEPRAMELFSKAGCDVSDGIVKFPDELVRSSVDSVGRSFRLWNRPGEEFLDFDDQHTNFMAGVTCSNVVDLETGKQRPATADDIATITRVADSLANIDGMCLPCKIAEKPNIAGQIEEFATMARNTSKPLSYLCEDEQPLEAAIEMATAIRGGAEQLRNKPYFCFFVTPLPLYFAEIHINHIFQCVENGIPLTSLTVTIGGASAPVTVAGSVVQSLATDFACIVLSQLIEKGSYCGCGSVLAFIDPMSGQMGGLPEMDLGELAKSQALRHLGLPPAGSLAGGVGGARFGQYAVSLATASMLRTFYSRPGHSWHLGIIDSGTTFSLHALLYCNELAGYVRRMWTGIQVDDETLALDIARSIGPGGDYLAEMHTANHCRKELWNTKYFQAALMSQTGGDSGSERDLINEIDADLQEILANHQPEPLADSVRKQIDAILKNHGV